MTLADLSVIDTWYALGGGELRRGRGQAFDRGGDGYSVHIDAAQNCWYDHRDGVGGGVLALVEKAFKCSRRDALAWLEIHCGLEPRRPLGDAERHARAAAPALAQQLADFARGLEIVVERQLAAAQAARIDPGDIPAWHRQAHVIRMATARNLAALWRDSPSERDAVERLGQLDRQHAQMVTDAIVRIIAIAQEQEGQQP